MILNLRFDFKDLINGRSNLPSSILIRDSILYRIHDKKRNKNYIGTAKYGMPDRLYNGYYSHVSLFNLRNKTRCRGMYMNMSDCIEDFELYLEEVESPNNYQYILKRETELIEQYDSVLNGYNLCLDGKPGWKSNTVCVNDGNFDLYIRKEDVDRFIKQGYVLGSCKHYNLRGTIWVNNGVTSKMIDPSDFLKFERLGYKKGNLTSPNSGKMWVNNGVVSKLISKDQFKSDLYRDFIYTGRIEKPRKKRGKYKAEKKTFVNDGIKELRVPLSKVDDFLSRNQNFRRGRKKNKIV